MRSLALILTSVAVAAQAATLEKLSLDDMIIKSTAVVRGKVAGSSASFRGVPGRGGMIYTHYALSVSETYKGPPAAKLDVAVPGGTAQGYRQVFAGAPSLKNGDEFVFFLWTSRTGLTQIIGLTQGLFSLNTGSGGKVMLNRNVTSEVLLDPATGNAVADSGLRVPLSTLVERIQQLTGASQ